MAKIKKVAKTSCDGYYLVERAGDEITYAFPGYATCPKDVQRYIDKNEIKEIFSFWMDAIAYRYF